MSAHNSATLPINDVLPQLQQALCEGHELVLEAPPGAGKTTRVPLELLQAPWLGKQRIVMLEPRRVAARAAAAHMAQQLGEAVGDTVGYRVRMDSRVGPDTRIEVVTEGILARRLQSDPALSGIGLLIFDEFHERNLDSDLGLALALQSRELFRDGPPLKLLVMSATLDGAAVSALLGDAPVLSSRGRQYPVVVDYTPAPRANEPVVPAVASLVRRALAEREGNILVFLPGQREIRRLGQALEEAARRSDVVISELHGGLSLEQQQAAMQPAPRGQRKVVLATNLAETSLTIEGIALVVDSGQVREARFDPLTGTTRLRTRRVSRASAEQRRGRAGRLGPGHCYRLWSEEQQGRLQPHAAPEIQYADLAPLALQLLAWGEPDPGGLAWLDPPPASAYRQGQDLLLRLGAARNHQDGLVLTTRGEAMAALPLHPRLAHLLLRGVELNCLKEAALLAALLSERLPPALPGCDLDEVLKRLQGNQLSARLAGWAARCRRQARRFEALAAAADLPRRASSPDAADIAAVLLASAFPDRVARLRPGQGGLSYQLANGRSATLPANDPLAHSEWLAVADLGGQEGHSADRIHAAAALDPRQFSGPLAALVEERQHLSWDQREDRLLAERRHCIGRIVLKREPLQEVDPEARRQALLALVEERGLALFNWTPSVQQWRARVALMRELEGERWPDLSDAGLLASLPDWLGPWLDPVRRLQDFTALDMATLLGARLAWPLPQELDEQLPERLQVPSGSRIRLDYTCSPPVLAVKLQEMFGCAETPTVASGRVALQVHLLSPAQRPLQVTQDLAGFWSGSYEAVKKEMRGRYPKHPWPDDPARAVPTRHSKRRRSGD